ncbi:hypothetical protein HDU76_013948 [Blyttiomyces sp. JEL0837]|nr:hypothetical protein HDU76_013948 [Blyttiomyces sp. JEL0837]
MKSTSHYRFNNWAETFSSDADLLLEAENEEDVKTAITLAKDNGKTLRVVGSGHSPSDIVCTESYLLSVNKLNRVISVDRERKQISVEAGMTLNDLHRHLAEHGLAVPNLGSISDQTIAGAISTGTHGTGMEFGILATMITSLTLITSTLSTLTLSNTDPDPTRFRHALCSLGCLGVITRVTLQVEDSFNLKFEQRAATLTEVLDNWESLAREGEHPISPPPPAPLKTKWLGVRAYELSLFATVYAPRLLPIVLKRHFDRFFRTPVSGIDTSVNVFNFDCLFKQYVTEWAVDWKDAPEAIKRIKIHLESSNFPAHAPVEIRFVKKDDIPLSPAYNRDTCFIGIIMYRPYGVTIPHSKYWFAYESIMKSLNGRPHWAKFHPMTPEDLGKVYPEFEDFRRLREELDPENVFVNEYIERHVVGAGRLVRDGKRVVKAKL